MSHNFWVIYLEEIYPYLMLSDFILYQVLWMFAMSTTTVQCAITPHVHTTATGQRKQTAGDVGPETQNQRRLLRSLQCDPRKKAPALLIIFAIWSQTVPPASVWKTASACGAKMWPSVSLLPPTSTSTRTDSVWSGGIVATAKVSSALHTGKTKLFFSLLD